jgi:OPT family small oligopeptide transporter
MASTPEFNDISSHSPVPLRSLGSREGSRRIASLLEENLSDVPASAEPSRASIEVIDSMPTPFAGAAPFLRESNAFTEPSYGAMASVTVARQSEDGGDSQSSIAESQIRRRRRSRSGSHGRLLKDVRSGSNLTEELNGMAALTGMDSRLGIADLPVHPELVEDDTFSGRDEERALIDDDDDEVSEEDDPLNPPDNSPYPQVRASVPAIDDLTLSINTPRMWALSLLFSILGSSTNLFFALRYPSVAITPVIALLLVHPLGMLWDYCLKRADDPSENFSDGMRVKNSMTRLAAVGRGTRRHRLRLWLAQGAWNQKEHACVYVSSNVSFGFAFATDVIVEQTQFYKQNASIVYQLLLTLSTQILGYTFAGLARRFLVRPSGMIWPGTLMSAAMFSTLHRDENKVADGWRISRWKFFYIIFLGAFCFYFLPGLLMPALSYFNVITWAKPDSVVLANLFGVFSGLGLFPMVFDWAQITYIGSPLLTPFWAAMNIMGGLLLVMWIAAPIAYYSNWLYTSYMPILSTAVFDNTGQVYNVSRILTEDFLFDREAYQNYSRVYLPVTYVLSYGVQFAGLASLVTHTACWHGRDIWHEWCKSLQPAQTATKASYKAVPASSTTSQESLPPQPPLRRQSTNSSSGLDDIVGHEDVHNRLMSRYPEAPMLWYLLTFVSMTAVGIFVVEYYPIHLPWYGLLLALGICAVLFIPIGIIMAITNQHSSIYLLCQLICGVIFPGRPVANMIFVTYGYISSAQGVKFAADMKLGHYMKIPPRILFGVQMVATVVSSITQIVVLNWMFRNVPGLCTSDAVDGFTCPIARVHFNGSILWGVVGPTEFFGRNATYRSLLWAFLIGLVLPIPLWWYAKGKKQSLMRKINLPVMLGSLGWIPPATGINFSAWALVCLVFNYSLKNKAPAWWAKYTMTLSAALDSGLAFGILVVFFGFLYPGWMTDFHWWATEIYKQGCDWNACAWKTVPAGGRFGPDTW